MLSYQLSTRISHNYFSPVISINSTGNSVLKRLPHLPALSSEGSVMKSRPPAAPAPPTSVITAPPTYGKLISQEGEVAINAAGVRQVSVNRKAFFFFF